MSAPFFPRYWHEPNTTTWYYDFAPQKRLRINSNSALDFGIAYSVNGVPSSTAVATSDSDFIKIYEVVLPIIYNNLGKEGIRQTGLPMVPKAGINSYEEGRRLEDDLHQACADYITHRNQVPRLAVLGSMTFELIQHYRLCVSDPTNIPTNYYQYSQNRDSRVELLTDIQTLNRIELYG